jgi:hypothetical protein
MWWLFMGLGVVVVEALAYWLIQRTNVSKTLTLATVVSAVLMLFPLVGLALL